MLAVRPEIRRSPRKVVIRFLDALLRDTLANWVDSLPGYEVTGAVSNGPALVKLCTVQAPDVAVVQLGSAEIDELTLITELRGVRPIPHVVGLHYALDPRSLLRLYRAGANRLVSSRFGLPALRAALGEAGSEPMARPPTNGLSDRELEILALITAGCSASDIAEALEISPHTVTNHKRRIFAKLDVHSRAQAAAEGVRLGLLRGPGGRGADPVRGRSGPLRDEVARILATNRKFARVGVSVLVNPVDSTWRAGEPAGDKVVVIGREHSNSNAIADALGHGARAVLTDEHLTERLPAVIALVKAGYLVASEEVVRALFAGAPTTGRRPTLTRRERDILASVAVGHSVRQTAQSLGIAIKTVQSEQRQLFSKLGARNRLDALALAREQGLVDP